MASSRSEPAPDASRRGRFATTRWSIVQRAAGDGSLARDALADLCGTYWYPLYAHVRRRGYPAHDAQDLTQEFFARLLSGDLIERADPARGRFRSYVLTALTHFLADMRDKSRAAKRGGGSVPVPIDAGAAEARFGNEPVDRAAPDLAFDRAWAISLLEHVLGVLEREYTAAGKSAHFKALRSALTGTRESQPYHELADTLGMTEGAVKVAVHRLRRRYRELLEAEIAQTVASDDQTAAELNHLFQCLAQP